MCQVLPRLEKKAHPKKLDDLTRKGVRKVLKWLYRFAFREFTIDEYVMNSNRSNSREEGKVSGVPKPVLPFAPVRQNERQHYINMLISLYKTKNESLKLSKNEITARAVKWEYETASNNKQRGEYMAKMKRLLFNIKKYGSEDANAPVKESNSKEEDDNAKYGVRGKYGVNHNYDDLLKHLKQLCISKERLKRHGYVTEAPEAEELPVSVDCGNCQISFQVSEIKSPTQCTFHFGKVLTSTYENLKLGYKIYGTQYSDKAYTCCKQLKGQSLGCKTNRHHVYKLKEASQLQKVKPFKTITDLRRELRINSDSKIQLKRKEKINAVGIDCEMCYTDKGFEMMKISVIDFKTEKPILNTIVHPDGEFIIDLNSHVSGVDEIPKNSLTFDEIIIKLAELTDEDTIIIGHGLENDLNVLRLIYPNIIDTAILLSENQVDVRRKDPLKKIAWEYLSENIQADSHDSLEDAIVPIRIIKAYITKRLDRLKNLN